MVKPGIRLHILDGKKLTNALIHALSLDKMVQLSGSVLRWVGEDGLTDLLYVV